MSNTERQLISEKIKFELVWEALEKLGIASLEVTFSGEGDSGEINDIAPVLPTLNADNMTADEHTAAREKASDTLNAQFVAFDTAMVELDRGNQIQLRKLVEELTDTFITSHDDWWNDDGGYGTATWYVEQGDDDDAAARSIVVEINVRIVNTEYFRYNHNRHGQEQTDDPAVDMAPVTSAGARGDV